MKTLHPKISNPVYPIYTLFRYLSILLILNPFLGRSQSDEPLPNDVAEAMKGWREVYFSFPLPANMNTERAGEWISVDNIRDDSVFAYANAREFRIFMKEGIPYKVLRHPGFLENPSMIDKVDLLQPQSWDYYPTYNAYESIMAQFQANYPSLCDIDTLALLPSGRRILMARIGDNVQQRENEPQFLYTASIHGDETVGYITMLHLIDYLLSGYLINPKITYLLNRIEIFINPLANPDATYNGGNNTVSGAIRYNSNGIDLNRNFPDPFLGTNPYGNPTQLETQAFIEFALNHNINLSANFHGGAEVINYPWDHKTALHPDDSWWIQLCREYADTVHAHAPSGYLNDLNNGITNGAAWYIVHGGRQDYMTWYRNGREITAEISQTKNPPANTLTGYWEYNYRSLVNYMAQSLYGIRGVVTDTLTAVPLRAKITIIGHDYDSSFVYTSLPLGDYHRYLYHGVYNLTFSSPGYFPKTINGINVVDQASQTIDVKLVPLPGIASVRGKLAYDNASLTALSNVAIQLTDSLGNMAASSTSNLKGEFSFNQIPAGNYQLHYILLKPSGGYNATDALLALKHFVGISPITGLAGEAGDVNDNAVINSFDALLIQRRFVGLLSDFPRGEWVFSLSNLSLSSGTIIGNILGLSVGDVDRSYIPPLNP